MSNSFGTLFRWFFWKLLTSEWDVSFYSKFNSDMFSPDSWGITDLKFFLLKLWSQLFRSSFFYVSQRRLVTASVFWNPSHSLRSFNFFLWPWLEVSQYRTQQTSVYCMKWQKFFQFGGNLLIACFNNKALFRSALFEKIWTTKTRLLPKEVLVTIPSEPWQCME